MLIYYKKKVFVVLRLTLAQSNTNTLLPLGIRLYPLWTNNSVNKPIV